MNQVRDFKLYHWQGGPQKGKSGGYYVIARP